MRDWRGRRYWLVGASEGLGRALALRLSAEGAELVVSARNKGRLEDLVAALPGPARAVAVDVSSRASVAAAAAAAGEIDGLVYLAAVYWPMSARAWDADRAEAMADINFTGCLRVLGATVPGMVARGHGHVVLTGSLAGYRGLPGAVGYGATKAAVMSLAETMRTDLRGTGVEVQLACPGFIRTRLSGRNDFPMPFLMTPEAAAGAMVALMDGHGFRKCFPFGFGLFFRAARILPDRVWDRLVGGRPEGVARAPGSRNTRIRATGRGEAAMLEISAGKVAYVAILAREIDVKVAPWDAEGDDTDSDGGAILEAHADDPAIQQFTEFVDGLNEDEQASLVAVMWIGRDTFTADDLEEAIETAKQEAINSTSEYLMGVPLLADYLEAGLEALGIDPEQEEDELY